MAKKFESGVSFYTEGTARIPVYFPEEDVCCRWCPFCRAEKELGRYWCRLTNDMIYDPSAGIGDKCPIELKKEDTDWTEQGQTD